MSDKLSLIIHKTWYIFFLFIFSGCLMCLSAYAQIPGFNKDTFALELHKDTDLKKELDEELKKQHKTNRVLKQLSSLKKITRLEQTLLLEKLRSKGYYAANVVSTSNDKKSYHTIDPGALYRVEKIIIDTPDHVKSLKLWQPLLKKNDILHAQAVLDAKNSFTKYVEKNACLYRIRTSYHVTVIHENASAIVTFSLADSPTVNFGDITLNGLRSIRKDYLLKQLGFKKGDCFKRNLVDFSRIQLIQTNLVTSINAEYSEPKNNQVDVVIEVTERKHRTLTTGLSYQSDIRGGVLLGWEHRNLKGRAEKLSIELNLSDREQAIQSEFTLSNFRKDGQTLTLFADALQQQTDAFDSTIGVVGIQLSRKLRPSLRGSIGSDIEFSDITDFAQDDNEQFALLSLPLTFDYDTRRNPLNPKNGHAVNLRLRPYIDLYNEDTQFLKTTLTGSTYKTLNTLWAKPTLALRAATGSITGTNRQDIPSNALYFVGGGGSVRGYRFQALTPRRDGVIQGGFSFGEISFETRLHFGDSWGAAWFIDGGRAYEDDLPEFGTNFCYGTGFGVRYFTSFAPIRLDFGVPINGEDCDDSSIQIYASIGQAF